MFALSAVLLFFGHHGTKALSMLSPSDTDNQAQAAFLSCPLKRTVLNIIWGCLTTIFLSTWVAIHPNIPPPGQFNTSRRQVQLMLWTLVMPEYILVWAARQWLAAWEIRDTYTTKKGIFMHWTYVQPPTFRISVQQQKADAATLRVDRQAMVWGERTET